MSGFLCIPASWLVIDAIDEHSRSIKLVCGNSKWKDVLLLNAMEISKIKFTFVVLLKKIPLKEDHCLLLIGNLYALMPITLPLCQQTSFRLLLFAPARAGFCTLQMSLHFCSFSVVSCSLLDAASSALLSPRPAPKYQQPLLSNFLHFSPPPDHRIPSASPLPNFFPADIPRWGIKSVE